jgi:CheY-like chemotaxis protein
MTANLCPVCRSVIPTDAQRCSVCGAALDEWDARAPPVRPPTEGRPASALWLDDPVAPPHPPEPADEPEAAPLSITLREIDLPPPPEVLAGPPSPRPPTSAEGLVMSDPEPPLITEAAQLALNKTARRATVRRERLLGESAAGVAAPTVPEVLVLDADDTARDQICSLLRAFGFGVHAANDAGKASALVASRAFAAAFVDIALDGADGGAGIDLCKHVRNASRRRGGAPTLLVLVAAQLPPTDRVRADLAGCDEVILKPVTRGSVARVLDSHHIVLPSDLRRA